MRSLFRKNEQAIERKREDERTYVCVFMYACVQVCIHKIHVFQTKPTGTPPHTYTRQPIGPAVLLNAVYFKGEWGSKFDEKSTRPGTFNTLTGAAIPCQYMQKSEKRMLVRMCSTKIILELSLNYPISYADRSHETFVQDKFPV